MSDDNSVDAILERLQHESFNYFLHETNAANGLVIDKNEANWPASIAATGLALAAYPVAVERGFMLRPAAGQRTLNPLRFFWNSPQGADLPQTRAINLFDADGAELNSSRGTPLPHF